MKKYIVLYHAPASSMGKMKNMSPEEMKKGMEPWMKWAKQCGKGLVDLGSPLGNGQKLSSKGSSRSNREVVGYSVLQAKDMDAAKGMLKEHPHLKWAGQCEIEVHESMPMS
jgi:hypothetical protein